MMTEACCSQSLKMWRQPGVELYAIDKRVTTRRGEISQDIRTLIGLLAQGAIRPRIGVRIPLADAAKAHELIESRNNIEKITLVT